jgi:hypothetical protein
MYVLPSARLGALAALLCVGCLASPQGALADSPKTGAPATSIVLPPVAVLGKPVSSFGLSLRLLRNEATQRTLLVTITDVEPGSDAQKKGLGAGTDIMSIDGIDVHEFKATFAYGSELNAKLLQRGPGERITLEILPAGALKPTVVTLVEGRRRERDAEVQPFSIKHVTLAGSGP